MKRNLNDYIEITNLREVGIEKINELLDQGKTLLIALEKGENVEKNLKERYSQFFKANIELKEEKENCGVCGCGKPANALVYMWREKENK